MNTSNTMNLQHQIGAIKPMTTREVASRMNMTILGLHKMVDCIRPDKDMPFRIRLKMSLSHVVKFNTLKRAEYAKPILKDMVLLEITNAHKESQFDELKENRINKLNKVISKHAILLNKTKSMQYKYNSYTSD